VVTVAADAVSVVDVCFEVGVAPVHHLSDELLTAAAAGLLAEPLLLVARTHMALCGTCRARERELVAIGGALLDTGAPVLVSAELRDLVLAALDRPMGTRPRHCETATGDVPEPLVPHVGPRFQDLAWRSFGSVGEIRLLPEAQGYVTRLLRIRPGAGVPDHTHEGLEATVVIKGAFSDCTGRYGPGDVALVEGDLDHSPVAEAGEPCICLAVTDAPLRLTGSIGRFLNPFVRL
jgi:putative transcriptional regulator